MSDLSDVGYETLDRQPKYANYPAGRINAELRATAALELGIFIQQRAAQFTNNNDLTNAVITQAISSDVASAIRPWTARKGSINETLTIPLPRRACHFLSELFLSQLTYLSVDRKKQLEFMGWAQWLQRLGGPVPAPPPVEPTPPEVVPQADPRPVPVPELPSATESSSPLVKKPWWKFW